ncbi:MAG: RNA 2',3'-cyclic phosphodiesterase [Candidatus Diapherotrites archaeon]|nr:RNA 2',3'-cyclic phosphodiesterase [Candidatus Diapherotrites archaeon]
MSTKRLFIAVSVPENIKQEINNLVLNLKKNKCLEGLRFVEKENLHITLKFIGYMPEEKLDELISALDKVSFKPFNIEIKGFSHFKYRVLFIDIIKGRDFLESLAFRINETLGTHDNFRAHLTIARNKNMQKDNFLEVLDILNKEDFNQSFSVKSFELIESVLYSHGPKYKTIFSKLSSSS